MHKVKKKNINQNLYFSPICERCLLQTRPQLGLNSWKRERVPPHTLSIYIFLYMCVCGHNFCCVLNNDLLVSEILPPSFGSTVQQPSTFCQVGHSNTALVLLGRELNSCLHSYNSAGKKTQNIILETNPFRIFSHTLLDHISLTPAGSVLDNNNSLV